jgi:hypothetical protein
MIVAHNKDDSNPLDNAKIFKKKKKKKKET